jgi:hypothetical protein
MSGSRELLGQFAGSLERVQSCSFKRDINLSKAHIVYGVRGGAFG